MLLESRATDGAQPHKIDRPGPLRSLFDHHLRPIIPRPEANFRPGALVSLGLRKF